MIRDGYYMSATDAQEELEEVQADLKKREDEVRARVRTPVSLTTTTRRIGILKLSSFHFFFVLRSLKRRLYRRRCCPMWKVV